MEGLNFVWIDDSEKKVLEDFYANLPSTEKGDLVFEFSKDKFIKVTLEDDIIGIGSITNDSGPHVFFQRFILSQYRGDKIGDKLLNEIIAHAKSNGKMWIKGFFKADKLKAKAYFSDKGFKIVDGGIIRYSEKYSTVIMRL